MPTRDRRHQKRNAQESPTRKQAQMEPAAVSSDISLTKGILHPELASPATVLQLQRLVGNQATRRLLPVPHRAPANTVQRAETGIRQAGTMSGIVGTIHTKLAEEKEKERLNTGTSMLLGPFMKQVVHAEFAKALRAIDVEPPREIKLQPRLGYGLFDPSKWTITLDPLIHLGGANRAGEVDAGVAKEMVNTVYHESRHCEQYFRIAQMRAGAILAQNDQMEEGAVVKKIEEETKVKGDAPVTPEATELIEMLHLPPDIILAAVKNPLVPSTTGKVMDEAKAWYESLYGTGSQYRKHVFDLQEVVGKTRQLLKKFRTIFDRLAPYTTSLPSTFSGSPNTGEQKDVTDLWDNLKTVTTTFKSRFTVEKSKVYSPPSSGVKKTMRDRIVKILASIAKIEAETTTHSDPIALWSKTPTTIWGSFVKIWYACFALAKDLDEAEPEFPEEEDAYATGNQAGTDYGSL